MTRPATPDTPSGRTPSGRTPAGRPSAGPAPLGMTFEGRPVPAAPGQSVGAALVAAGITAWRTTRLHGRPRGLFCGIGVCYDCLITVDGAPGQRACLVPAADGMRLTGDAPVPGDSHDA